MYRFFISPIFTPPIMPVKCKLNSDKKSDD